jgi:ribonuclease HII
LPAAHGLDFECLFEAVIKGDAKVPSISAASILAKTTRDALMRELDGAYPGFSLSRSQGLRHAYARGRDRSARSVLLHRRSFSPVGMRLIEAEDI